MTGAVYWRLNLPVDGSPQIFYYGRAALYSRCEGTNGVVPACLLPFSTYKRAGWAWAWKAWRRYRETC